MLEHFLIPVRSEVIEAARNGSSNIAAGLSTTLPKNVSTKCIGLVSADNRFTSSIRLPLYLMANRFANTQIVDLGAFRNTTSDFMVAPLETISELGVLPVLFMPTQHEAVNLLRILSKREPGKWRNAALIHEGTIANTKDLDQTTFTYLGAQSHLITNEMIKSVSEQQADLVRLSQVRDNFEDVEPTMRDADFIIFDLSAMRTSDLPGQRSRSTSGFFTEEAAKLMRYAGMSSRIRCIVITGADASHPRDFQTTNTSAQLLWYFISGYDAKVVEDPAIDDHFTSYIVDIPGYDFDLVFRKSEQSDRWWFSMPENGVSELHSCSYHDYLAACENIISGRILKVVSRSMNVIND